MTKDYGEDFQHVLEAVKLMNRKLKMNEADYQKWRKTQKQRIPYPRTDKPYLRGSDFKEYWTCWWRLWFRVHDPLPQKSRVNKGIYEAIKRHEQIENHLEQYGWKSEVYVDTQTRLINFHLPFKGHIDSLSPNGLILDIKHNQPSQGDLMQLGSYSLHLGWQPVVVVYRTGFTFQETLARLMHKYLPRVLGCILLDKIPPLHLNYPNCYYNCEYYKRCKRTRKPPKKPPIPQDVTDWLQAVEDEKFLG